MDDLIRRQAAIDAIMGQPPEPHYPSWYAEQIKALPSAQPEKQHGRIFQEIVVKYPSYNPYPERKGKPYFSIKYTENGQEFIGYGTYKPEVLSEYLKEYFMPSAQPEERKKGAWILGFDNQYLEKYYFCSKCGSRKYMEDKPLDNFCANCGADMRGEQDG